MKSSTTTILVCLFILTSSIKGNILVGSTNGTKFELNAVEIIYLRKFINIIIFNIPF